MPVASSLIRARVPGSARRKSGDVVLANPFLSSSNASELDIAGRAAARRGKESMRTSACALLLLAAMKDHPEAYARIDANLETLREGESSFVAGHRGFGSGSIDGPLISIEKNTPASITDYPQFLKRSGYPDRAPGPATR